MLKYKRDGTEYFHTPEEETKIRDEWALNDAKPRKDFLDLELEQSPVKRILLQELAAVTGKTVESMKTLIRNEMLDAE